MSTVPETGFIVVNVRTVGPENNLNTNRMVALGAVVIKASDIEKVSEEKLGCVRFLNNNKLSVSDVYRLIPEENRFYVYINDQEALNRIEEEKPLNAQIQEIKSSRYGPEEAIQQFDNWYQGVVKQYKGNTILLSNKSDFDFFWVDTYYANYLQKSLGFILRLDTTSFYFGLTASKYKIDYNSWLLHTTKLLKSSGFALPDVELEPEWAEYHPLYCVFENAIELACVVYQHNIICSRQTKCNLIRRE
jgi:hypothetical protein